MATTTRQVRSPVPCVIGTRTGTNNLCDGDGIRVDGSTGRVTILNRGSAR